MVLPHMIQNRPNMMQNTQQQVNPNMQNIIGQQQQQQQQQVAPPPPYPEPPPPYPGQTQNQVGTLLFSIFFSFKTFFLWCEFSLIFFETILKLIF
jgi:hypothetical protein